MKRISLIFFLLTSIVSMGQENFQINDGDLIWRKVYTDSVSVESVVYNLRNDGHFRQIEISGDIITAELRGLMMEYRSLGYNRMSLPLYVCNNTYNGFVTVELREGRYRVTIDRIITHSSRMGDMRLDELALDLGGFDPTFMQAPCRIISANFDSIFSKLSRDTTDDEW